MEMHRRGMKLAAIAALYLLIFILFSSCTPGDTQENSRLKTVVPLDAQARQEPVQSSEEDWPDYLLGNGNFNPRETVITRSSAPDLQLLWSYQAKGAISAQPIEVNGRLYVGAWDGLERALDLNGQQIWATTLGTTKDDDCDPAEAGVAGTPTVLSMLIGGQQMQVLFVGGGNGNFYALNAINGQVIWKTLLGAPPDNFIWSSPVLYQGSVYVGLSSFGDCPLIQSKLFRLDAVTGAVQNVFNTVPDGCIGGSIWGSPVIDTRAGTIYFTTGNADDDDCPAGEPYAPALVELHLPNLSLVDYWQVPPSQWSEDSDFGSTPTLFTAAINGTVQEMVGAVNKNGFYYAFRRGQLSNGPVWSDQVAVSEGSMSPSAWDGTWLYIGGTNTTIGGQSCQGGLRAVDPATGKYIWERCLQDGRVMGPVTVIPGVVIVGEGRTLAVLDAASGQPLFGYRDRSNGSYFWSAATIVHGVIYVGNMDGNFYAFGLRG
jgi:outer membrane protein assembly factor BamB